MSLEDLQRKQANVAKSAMKMVDEKDPQALLEMAAQIQEQCKDLEKAAKNLAAALAPQEPTGQEVRVTLTPDQKKRITEQTGVGVEVVTVYDTKKKMWSRDLPLGKIEPREIEKMAAQQAAQSKLISETRAQVEKIVKQLKALNVPEISEQIEALEKDPTLGLGKKK
jgi:tetrahydromethanopterin S-methyltransferase subunit B